MKNTNLFWVGLTVFVTSVAFILGFLYMQDIRFQKSNFTLTVIFDSAQGLNEGVHVNMLGKRIGKVSRIRIIEGKKIAVLLSIDNTFAFKIPVDSKINVKSEGILGTKYISIEPGTDTKHSLLAGDTVEGIREIDFSEITPGIVPLTQDIGAFARRLKATLGEEERVKIQGTISNIEKFTSEMVEFMQESRSLISEEERENIRQFTENLKESTESFKSATNELESTLKKDLKSIETIMTGLKQFTSKADEFNEAIVAFKETSESFKQTASEVKSSSEKLSKTINSLSGTEGSLPRLLNDNSLYNHMDSLVLEVRMIVDDFSENPGKYIKAYLKAKK